SAVSGLRLYLLTVNFLRKYMIPHSTLQVIAQSDFYVEAEHFYVLQASRVGTPERHRLICHDEKEITVITTAAQLADVDIIARNKEQWRLLVINCAKPFYCVGFLTAISTAMTNAGLDILLTSTFSRDLVFVPQQHIAQAIELLLQLGFHQQQTAAT
ncbi:MAG: ACT domain-containing protein, partial [Gammaproteobacteria bacterium]|nr:ACT domain-containing protein [Gammaproteobacteria bacterium]